MHLRFAYQFDATGHTATATLEQHVAQMIEQLLLTSPGERVNRPSFGTGTGQLVFAPLSDALAAAQQQIIRASLQQWLSALILVQDVSVTAVESTLTVSIQYILLATRQAQTQTVIVGGAA